MDMLVISTFYPTPGTMLSTIIYVINTRQRFNVLGIVLLSISRHALKTHTSQVGRGFT